MGVLGADITISRNDGTGSYGEAVTLGESPLDPDILWVGMDDGNLQVSQDGGASWTEVSGNVPGLPAGTYVSRITASSRAPGHAWAAFDAHRDGDFAPYVYFSTDFGRSWEPRHAGLPSGSVNVDHRAPRQPGRPLPGHRACPLRSTDHGRSWAKYPAPPPRRTTIWSSTPGRRTWSSAPTATGSGSWTTWARWRTGRPRWPHPTPTSSTSPGPPSTYWKDTSYRGNAEFAGENPPDGAYIAYKLGPGSGEARLTVTDGSGKVMREIIVPSEPGMHRVNWDLSRGDEPDVWEAWESPVLARSTSSRAPEVMPGTYTVTLEARGRTMSKEVVVRADPESGLTMQQFAEREAYIVEAEQLATDLQEIAARLQAAQASASGTRAQELQEMMRRVQQAMRTAQRAPGQLGSGGVRQGTLHPPTETMKQGLVEAREALAAARALIGAGGLPG